MVSTKRPWYLYALEFATVIAVALFLGAVMVIGNFIVSLL